MSYGGIILLSGALCAGQMKEEFNYDFCDKSKQGMLQLFGPRASAVSKQTLEGLRITLPAERRDLGSVGVIPRFFVHGDFEITASFDLLEAPKPTKGHGVGVSLWVKLYDSPSEGATLARLVRKEGSFFVADRSFKDAKNKTSHEIKTLASEAKKGRLQLARKGAFLHFLVSEETGGDLHELFKTAIGSEDLERIKLSATTGGDASEVDVRLVTLNVRADKLSVGPYSDTAWTILAISGAGGAVIVIVAAWAIYRRLMRRKNAHQRPALGVGKLRERAHAT